MAVQGATAPAGSRRPRRGRNIHRSERGASAVEFAIVLSVLLLFVFGIIQFGIAYNRDQGIKAASREGARVASVGATEAEIAARVREAQSLFARDDVLVKIDYSQDNGANYSSPICDDSTPGDECTSNLAPTPCGTAGIASLVRVQAMVPGSTGKYAIVIPLWGNANVTYSSSGVFRCENK